MARQKRRVVRSHIPRLRNMSQRAVRRNRGRLRIVKLAVLSNNVFFDGRQVRWRKERWAERRKALQQAGRLSRVKKESGREQRWMRYINHCISKRIVEIAKAEGKAIALENLLGIRERAKGSKKFNRMMSGWNFRELASFIGYKAALAGVPVIYVDPKETSKTCPRCGNVSRYNRKTQGWLNAQDAATNLMPTGLEH